MLLLEICNQAFQLQSPVSESIKLTLILRPLCFGIQNLCEFRQCIDLTQRNFTQPELNGVLAVMLADARKNGNLSHNLSRER